MDQFAANRIDSLRYHAVGNAVTPHVAEWLGRRLAAVLTRRSSDQLRGSTADAQKMRRSASA
jgi:DNA (cytosine-5)-methyltransferase 1